MEEKIGISKRIGVYMIAAFILVFTLGFFISEKKDFSENENRKLAAWPEFSWASLRSGEFTEGVKDYASDHFPGRDGFLSVVTEAERYSGCKEMNGVYLAADGSLINAYELPQNVEKDITQWSKLAQNTQYAHVSLMLVPTAVSIYADRLPEGAPDALAQENYAKYGMRDGETLAVQQQTIDRIYAAMPESVDCIDVSAALHAEAESEERLYYRTDHHWTTHGAYVGYRAFCGSMGLEAIPLEEYRAETVTEDFKGTIYSKLNDPYFGADAITVYTHPDWQLQVDYGDKVTESPYNMDYLQKKDKYSLFLDNQHSLITVTNEAVEEGTIALVKDSYANSMVPFLLQHYHTVYIFDTRYYKGGPSKFINEHPEIEEVLILYNMGTLDKDIGIGGIY